MQTHIQRKNNQFILDLHNNKELSNPDKCEKSKCNRSIYYYISFIFILETMSNNMKILRYLASPQLLKENIARTLKTV